MVTMPTPIGAHVEIIEPLKPEGSWRPEEMPTIKPSIIRINGTDVGTVEKGSVMIDGGVSGDYSETLRVTLTLLARKVEIKAEVVHEELEATPAGGTQGPVEG
jgi:hypothetical protein